MPCFRIQYNKNSGNTSVWEADILRCVSSCSYVAGGNSKNGGPWLNCPDLSWDASSADVTAGRVTFISDDCANCSGNTPSGYVEPTTGVSPNQKFDCLNGGCIPAVTYSTPGFYANLAACQSGCAKNSNCTGECVEAAELAALQQAANNVRSKLCK
jgi:hypothetical protein